MCMYFLFLLHNLYPCNFYVELADSLSRVHYYLGLSWFLKINPWRTVSEVLPSAPPQHYFTSVSVDSLVITVT